MKKTNLDLIKLNKMLLKVQNPIKYVGGEFGLLPTSDLINRQVSFCLCFADIYEIGMSNFGNKILIDRLLKQGITRVERSFMPSKDFLQVLEKENEKLFSLETKMYLDCFDAVGFSLGYELCLTNMVKMMQIGGIEPLRDKRGEDAPIIIAGGPVCFNCAPIMDFCDIILVADGELSIPSVASLLKEKKEKSLSKLDFLKLVKDNVEGAVVPAFINFEYEKANVNKTSYENESENFHTCSLENCSHCEKSCNNKALQKVEKTSIDKFLPDNQIECKLDLSETTLKTRPIIKRINGDIVKRAIISRDEFAKPINYFYVPNTQIVQDKTTIEVFRGCTAGCRFCQAGFCYRPNRERTAKEIINQAIDLVKQTGHDEVTLSSLSTGDYSHLKEVVCALDKEFENNNIKISLPSLRVDTFEAEMVSKGHKGNITFAPEAGSDRLRKVINKNITEAEILTAMENAAKLGYTGVKLYFMMGLPTESNEDIIAIRDLALKIKDVFKKHKINKKEASITVSTSVFIPKPFTPFSWEAFATRADIEDKQKFLKEALRKVGIRYIYHGYNDSLIECFLSRGGKEIGKAILNAVNLGVCLESDTQNFDFSLWKKAIKEAGLNLNDFTLEIDENEILPWEVVDMGITKKYLLSERKKSRMGLQTSNCKKEECHNCGMLKYYKCTNGGK